MERIYISMIIMVIAIASATAVLQVRCHKKWPDIQANVGIIYGSIGIILGVLLGRVYYYFLDSTNMNANFFVPEMQFGMYGVFVGVLLAAVIICLVFKIDLREFLDILAPELLLVLMAQRINDFFLGTNFGRMVESDLLKHFPLSVFFSIGNTGFYVMAVFAYEFILCLLIFIFIMSRSKYNGKGINFLFALGIYGFGRVVFESMRQDSIYTGFVKIAQVVSIVLALGMLITLITICARKKVIKLPVVIICSFVIVATVTVAFLCEFYMGSEVEVLYTAIIAAMMAVLAVMLLILYLSYFKKVVDIGNN